MTTKQAQAKFLADCSHCPNCDSDDIDHKPNHDGSQPAEEHYSGWCNKCNATWTEVYTLTTVFDFDPDGNK